MGTWIMLRDFASMLAIFAEGSPPVRPFSLRVEENHRGRATSAYGAYPLFSTPPRIRDGVNWK